MMRRMTIGEAADTIGVSTKAIRLWEAKELIPDIERTQAGYRLFGEGDLAVLRFIHRAKMLGMTLGEIKSILDLQRVGSIPCERVTQMLDARIVEVDRSVRELLQLRRMLCAVRKHAERAHEVESDTVVCHIIQRAGKAI